MTNACDCVIDASIAAMSFVASPVPSFAQGPLPSQPEFGKLHVEAAQASPGWLSVKVGRTENGTNVIFAWFESKQALVTWHKSDFYQWAMKRVFPKQTFEREPMPDVPENNRPILALVTLKLAEALQPGSPIPIETTGIELYTPLPDGVAVGGRFVPQSVTVPGMRQFDVKDSCGTTALERVPNRVDLPFARHRGPNRVTIFSSQEDGLHDQSADQVGDRNGAINVNVARSKPYQSGKFDQTADLTLAAC